MSSSKHAARRQEVLDVAMQMVLEGGLETLTIARLAKQLNASVGGLYRYFSNKEAILVALQQQAIESYHTTLLSEVERAETFLMEQPEPSSQEAAKCVFKIMVGFSTYLRDALLSPSRHRLMDVFLSVPTPVLSDEQAVAVNDTLRPIIRMHAVMLDDAVKVDVFRTGDAVQRTHLVWAFMHGLDHFRKRDRIQPESLRIAALMNAGFRAMFVGWGAKPADMDTAFEWLEIYHESSMSVPITKEPCLEESGTLVVDPAMVALSMGQSEELSPQVSM
jgi:AcrR family transcriptional regulator